MTSPLPYNIYPEERRLATVLFANIQGFGYLAEHLDFEIITDLLKDVWLTVDEVIEKFGGYIDKHVGDSILAVWGAPMGGENDVEQAVKAGLALQQAIKEFSQESRLPGAAGIRIRMGIHTGPVLSGYFGKRHEYSILGDTVNVTVQLLQGCEPGQILISESTYRLVRGAFQVRRVNVPLNLQENNPSVVVYLVEGVSPQPSRARYRSEGSLETYMVGREIELERLNQLYQLAIREEKPVLVLITGESGIGKSRLLMEFTSQLEVKESTSSIISVRALSQTSHVPFYLWKALWFIRFGLQDSDPSEGTRDRFMREIQKLWGFQLGPASSVEAAHLVGSLIGLPFEESSFLEKYKEKTQNRLRRSFEMTSELLRRMSTYHPLVLLLDDLQFADNGSLELILFLMESSLERLPLLILGGARPEFAQRNPQWLNSAHILDLGPLAVNSDTVAAAYPALKNYPPVVLQEIAERSDGNPYFMEELSKSLLRSGIAPQSLPEIELVERVRSLPLESLRVMLQARLDSLSHEARSVALLASVVGRVFWVGAVYAAALVGEKLATGGLAVAAEDVLDRLVQDALRQLVRAELAFPLANTIFSEDQEYIFKHSLLREVAYNLIPHRHLAHYHRAVGQWMELREQPDFKLMAADHFELGQDYEKAAQLFEQSAEHILRQGAAREAQELIQKAKKLRATRKGI